MIPCPRCGANLNEKNLLKHYASVHPTDHPPQRQRPRKDRQPWTQRGKKQAAAVFISILVLILVAVFYHGSIDVNQPFPCVTGSLVYHWHTQLTMTVNNQPYTIPADIGLVGVCAEPVHTHDTSGLLHIETDQNRLYTIGDFFLIWGKPFGSPQTMLVNGTSATPSAGVILWDQEIILLNY